MVENYLMTPGLTSQDSADEGLRKYLRFYFSSLGQQAENALVCSDPEHIHKLRTSARRTRSALRIFREQLDKSSTAHQEQQLKEIGSLSTPVRDLDVMIPKVQQYLSEQTGQDPSGRMFTILDERQISARNHFIAYLGSEKFDQFKNDFAAYLSQPLIREEEKLQPYGKILLPRCLNNARKVLQMTDRTEIEKMHRLRIRLKNFRYGIELFSEALEAGTEEIINQMIRLQDHLGELHDTAVAEKILQSILQDMEKQDTAIDAYLDFLHTRLQTLFDEFHPLWDDFNSPAFEQLLTPVLYANQGFI